MDISYLLLAKEEDMALKDGVKSEIVYDGGMYFGCLYV